MQNKCIYIQAGPFDATELPLLLLLPAVIALPATDDSLEMALLRAGVPHVRHSGWNVQKMDKQTEHT